MLAGFGTRLDQPTSIARHERLQHWSVDVLARRAERLLGLRLEIDPAGSAVLTPGPVIVLCRHVNIVDASLPTLLYQRLGYRTCGVIMAELLADPGFDLIYARTGSVFIPRDNGAEAVAMVRGLGRSVDSKTAVVIFPEGRLFRHDRLERAKARLALDNPERGRTTGFTRSRPAATPRRGSRTSELDPRRCGRDRPRRSRPVRVVRRPRQSRSPPQRGPGHSLASSRRSDSGRR